MADVWPRRAVAEARGFGTAQRQADASGDESETSTPGNHMTPEERIDQLEKILETAVGKIAVLEYQLEQYDMVERMAFMSFVRTHPQATSDFVKIADIINPLKDKQLDKP